MNKDYVRLLHMQEAVLNILDITRDDSRDLKTELAVTRCLEILGEAAKGVSLETRMNYPEIPWKNMIATRNLLIHEYHRVEPATVWDIVEKKLPYLKESLDKIISDISSQK